MEKIDADLGVLGQQYNFDLKSRLHTAVNSCIHLRDCEVFKYVPDPEADDPFSDGWLGQFNYFFFNSRLKRMLYITCVARSRYAENSNNNKPLSTCPFDSMHQRVLHDQTPLLE